MNDRTAFRAGFAILAVLLLAAVLDTVFRSPKSTSETETVQLNREVSTSAVLSPTNDVTVSAVSFWMKNREVITIHADGNIELAEDASVDEASQAIWIAVEKHLQSEIRRKVMDEVKPLLKSGETLYWAQSWQEVEDWWSAQKEAALERSRNWTGTIPSDHCDMWMIINGQIYDYDTLSLACPSPNVPLEITK